MVNVSEIIAKKNRKNSFFRKFEYQQNEWRAMSKVEFPEKSIFVCVGSKCGKYKEIRKYLKESIKDKGLKHEVEIFKMECTDRCKHAPILSVQPQNDWYSETSYRDIDEIVKEL